MRARVATLAVTVALLAACGGDGAPAQRRPPARRDSSGGEVSRDSLSRILDSRGTYKRVEESRTSNGRPEVHDHFEDVVLVRSGRATLLSGGRVVGGGLVSPGEHRGGRIEGGASRQVSAGDRYTIDPGVPHQYLIAPGDSFRYLTVKVPRTR